MTNCRREVYFTGRVQGVGFRYKTQAIAIAHPVKGFVRNLSDGRVELVVEGNPHHLDQFIEEIVSSMSRYIEQSEAVTLDANGEFNEFQIRY